jgi:tRNA(Ser,Leu) C12 N-acetylase TAN1/endonuclease III
LFSSRLGIDLDTRRPSELFKWFLASMLFGARITESVAVRTYRAFEAHELLSPRKIAAAQFSELLQIMAEGGYVRYDGITSRKVQGAAGMLLDQYGGDLNRLHQASSDGEELTARLLAFKGVGPVTAQIFLRELRGIWPLAEPALGDLAMLAARHLGILDPAASFRRLNLPGHDFRHFEAALTRLGRDYCRRRRCAAAPIAHVPMPERQSEARIRGRTSRRSSSRRIAPRTTVRRGSPAAGNSRARAGAPRGRMADGRSPGHAEQIDPDLLVSYPWGCYRRAVREVLAALSGFGDSDARVERTDVQGIAVVHTSLDKRGVTVRCRKLHVGEHPFQFALKWVPVDHWCDTDLSAIKQLIDAEVAPCIAEKETWRMDVNKHGWSAYHTAEIIERLALDIDRTVALRSPDKIVRVEILRSTTAICLLGPGEIFSARAPGNVEVSQASPNAVPNNHTLPVRRGDGEHDVSAEGTPRT